MKVFNQITGFRGVVSALLLTVLGLAPLAVQAQTPPQEVLVNYSLAAEYYKNGDCESAAPYLRWLITHHPTTYQGERTLRRAADCYESLAETAKEAENEELRVAYLDSAIVVFDTAVTTLKDGGETPNEIKWAVDHGNFLLKYRADFPERDAEAVTHLIHAFELDPANLDPYYPRLIVQELTRLDMKQEAVEFMDKAETHYTDNAELVAFFNQSRDGLFKSPEERMAFLEGRLEKDPQDAEVATELFNLYRAMELSGKMEAMGQKLLAMEPSPRVYRLLAELKYENGAYAESIALNQKALDMAGEDDTTIKRDILYNMALSNYELSNLQAARNQARQTTRLDSKFGRGHMLIGDIYARSVTGSAFDREDRAVYWLVLDYYERAKRADESLTSTVNSKMSRYRGAMPTTEDKFFKGWKAGQSFPINYGRYAWIGETTTVR